MEQEANKAQVRRFYREIWDAKAYGLIPELLHPDFQFRGSLGTECLGHQGFADYVRRVHSSLANYRCHMEELVAEGDRVFARMRFVGRHVGPLLGYSASGGEICWDGAALFGFKKGQIASLWVLGDVKKLENQLRDHQAGL